MGISGLGEGDVTRLGAEDAAIDGDELFVDVQPDINKTTATRNRIAITANGLNCILDNILRCGYRLNNSYFFFEHLFLDCVKLLSSKKRKIETKS